MPVRRRCPPLLVLVLALVLQVPAFAQQVATDPPTRWQADAKANKKAAKQAEKAMPNRSAVACSRSNACTAAQNATKRKS